jgi:iron complex outermembrane receptor protein
MVNSKMTSRALRTRCLLLLSGAGGAFWLASVANAQSTVATPAGKAPATSTTPSPDAGVGDIIVTAQKRSERLRDVPMSITAATGNELRSRGIVSANDLGKLVPGFTYTKSDNGIPIYFIRGVGFYTTALGVSPAVTVYTDQLPLPYTPMSRGATLDIERVEVLKGPQGTLFGQNSTGGAINFIAAKPTDHFTAGFDLSGGRFNEVNSEAFISGPLANGLTARLAVRHEYQSDWQYNYQNGDKLGQKNFSNARLLLDWQASDRAKFELSMSGWKDRSDAQQAQLLKYTPLFSPAQAARPPSYPVASFPTAPDNDRAAGFAPGIDWRVNNRFYQFGLRSDFRVNDAIQLTALTAYNHLNYYAPFDLGANSYPDSIQTAEAKITSFSQEVRLSGSQKRLKWMVGGNFQRDTVDETWLFTGSTTGNRIPPNNYTSFQVDGDQKVNTYSGFGSVDYALTDQLTLQGSARYSKQDRDWTGCARDPGDGQTAFAFAALSSALTGTPQTIAPGACLTLGADYRPAGLIKSQLNQNNVSWRGSINYKPNTDTLLYAGVTRGYKAGAYPSLPLIQASQVQPVTQEAVTAYEVGAKTSLFDRVVDLSAATFYYDYRNKQLEGYRNVPIFGNLPSLVSIPKSRIWGAELALIVRPVKGLTINANGTYVNSKIQRDPTAPEGPYPEAESGPVSFVGQSFPLTPKWQSSVDVQYRTAFSGATDVFFGGSVTSRSKTTGKLLSNQASAASLENLLKIDGYSLVDLRAGFAAHDDRWRVEFWGRNIFNKFYAISAARANDSTFRFTGMPATFGVRLSFLFGS